MNRVKKFRKAQGITQTQLARMTGLPINTISTLERRNSNLQHTTARLISDALGVPVLTLMCKETEDHIWRDAEFPPENDGEYLIAYKIRPYNDYHFRVLTYKNKTWWETSPNGELISQSRIAISWWAEVNKPPI